MKTFTAPTLTAEKDHRPGSLGEAAQLAADARRAAVAAADRADRAGLARRVAEARS